MNVGVSIQHALLVAIETPVIRVAIGDCSQTSSDLRINDRATGSFLANCLAYWNVMYIFLSKLLPITFSLKI